MIPRLVPPVSLSNALTVLSTSSDDMNESPEGQLKEIFSDRDIYLTVSGRSAIYIALKSLGLSGGDEVIVPSFTCPVVLDAVISSGCVPVIVDVSPRNFAITPDNLKKAITERTRVVIFSYIFGLPADIEPIVEICNNEDIYLIEDTAQGLGIKVDGDYLGTYGDISVLSFNLDKHITSGGGGALLVKRSSGIEGVSSYLRDEEIDGEQDILGLILQTLLMKVNYDDFIPFTAGKDIVIKYNLKKDFIKKITERYLFWDDEPDEILDIEKMITGGDRKVFGILKNKIFSIIRPLFPPDISSISPISELDLLRKRLLSLELTRLEQLNEVRSRNTELLYGALSGLKKVAVVDEKFSNLPLLRFPIIVEDNSLRKKIEYNLNRSGFEVGLYNYPTPIHRIPAYRMRSKLAGQQRGSEYIVKTLLNLPVHIDMRKNDLKRMVEAIKKTI